MQIVATGVEGLDDILGGGLPAGHLYLLEGDPGAGKTTLALQFLMQGARLGERCLYITLSETKRELLGTAEGHGWSLEGIDVFELNAADQTTFGDDVTLFHPGEIQLGEAMKTLLDHVTRRDPHRVVFDSLSEIRLLAQAQLRYRRQILALKHHFADKQCTALLLDDRTAEPGDPQIMSIAHGVLMLEQSSPAYGSERRRLRVSKLRGRRFRGGFHDYVIETGGVRVFPRLVASEHRDVTTGERVSSGNQSFDALLGGGLTRGTSMLIAGAPGTGKSSLVATIVQAAAARGERSVVYLFDENVGAYLMRCEGIGLNLRDHVSAGTVKLNQVDPAELTPGEFVHMTRQAVESGASLIAIDSLNGYLASMQGEGHLIVQLHELLSFLAQRGVLSFLVTPQAGFMGAHVASTVDVSYLADTVVMMRYFEAQGAVRSAMSIVKQRTGWHEKTIREFSLTKSGVSVGEPLVQFHGVLSGLPEFTGQTKELFENGAAKEGDAR
jgi:circadian clock protein KaiC